MRCSAIAKSTNVRCKSVAIVGSEFCIHHVPRTSVVTKFDNKDDSECNLGEMLNQSPSVSSIEEIPTPKADVTPSDDASSIVTPAPVTDGYISGFLKYLGIW